MTSALNQAASKNISTGKKTILIIDDHKLIRDSLSHILNANVLYVVVGSYSTAEEGIRAAGMYRPDFVITDINLPGMNGMDAVALIKQASPATKVIGMSMHTQPAYARKMLRSGAMAYVTKNSHIEELLIAISEANEGRNYLCTEMKNTISEQYAKGDSAEMNMNSLSEREIGIIDLIKKGYSSKEMAAELFISVKTVEVHRYNILRKLKLSNSAALVNYINSNYME